jgi:replicative superfamily II helicase
MIQKLTLDDIEIPAVSPYTFLDKFNRVQSTIIANGLPTEDCNLVLGTATSTGKTISAELFIYATLPTKKKTLYVAPMKSLVREKFDEWQNRFGKDNVAILTGD